ncbi:DinB family protein [Botrimarina sp.]|uniref:DinB family protein n=1 Tax=Botrimarina sp. TaxID=2795802 RepID=UPI0032EB5D2E
MNDQLLRLYRFTLSACESLMADVAEEELWRQLPGGGNPPGWQLGHLAVVNSMALRMLGGEAALPGGWLESFGPGSQPVPDLAPAPGKDELLEQLRTTHAAVCDALGRVDLATLTEPNPIGLLAAALPTQGDLLAHILTTHAGMHLGHLSEWRRQMGRPPMF